MIESIQKQMVLFLNNDHTRRENNYSLSPYTERCMKFNLTTLTRRKINSTVLFLHMIISGKLKSHLLRSNINLRNPEFIRIGAHKSDSLQYSPFNNACFICNHVALFVDPSLPYDQFKRELLDLPDQAFGPWTDI